MGGVRSLGRFAAVLATVAVGLIPAPPSRAVEAFDGRVQLHGFYENQTRVIARNFDGNDDWDLTQWYHVLNLEMDLDIAPDGWGPFDIISGFVRVEARFDCVWDRACFIFPSANTYGDRARHLPKRLSDSRRTGFTGSQRTGDVRKRHGVPIDRLATIYGIPQPNAGNPFGAPQIFNDRKPMNIFNVPGIDTLFGGEGADGVIGTADDPAQFVLTRFLDFKFASRRVRGNVNGVGTQLLGPWLPKNFVKGVGALADRPNPFNPLDFISILPQRGNDPADGPPDPGDVLLNAAGMNTVADPSMSVPCGSPAVPNSNPALCFGANAREFRPAPLLAAGTVPLSKQFARGIFYPNSGLARLIADNKLDNPDQNFREAELKWNRGASQQQTKELKEAYLDIELFDSALWLRLGKQSIVWGKTELFRTTDQFNPQDLALATLPSLEESRISLWAARAVWSLFEVGPLEDVRLEVAANIDTFQGADLGICGEPYTVNVACNLRAGLFAHGITGFGLAGVTRPPDPWDDIKGLEVGFRAEFRWDRFSFAVTDFYGYDDFPFLDQIFRYERNVDPYTGRLRRNESRQPCDPDSLRPASAGGVGVTTGCLGPDGDALVNHAANQQLFAFICSTSIGFTTLDSSVCAQSVFNSSTVVSGFPIADVISAILTGDPQGTGLAALLVGVLTGTPYLGQDIPIVDLAFADRNNNGADIFDNPANNGFGTLPHLDNHLSQQQRALLGCGSLMGPMQAAAVRPCSSFGIDLLNAEASALTSAWITQPGVTDTDFITMAANGNPAPGTVAWAAANPRFSCQRYVNDVGIVILPGCRGPAEPGYDASATSVDFDPSAIGVNEGGDAINLGSGLASALITGVFNCAPANEGPGTSGILGGAAIAGGWCGTGNPFTGSVWRSTMDAFSWNFQMLLVLFTAIGARGLDDIAGTADDFVDIDVFDPTNPIAIDKCSFAAPQFCSNVSAILSVMGRRRNTLDAGGNGRFGRQDFVWHGGTSNRLKWKKRNVLGFSMDFAEDRTKTNWSMETTWIHNLVVANNDSLDGASEIDQFNLTVSVDRPTFVNFLNQGRTIFINSQWFFRYEQGFERAMPRNGPWNVLFTLTAFTGFYQDRLNPSITSVYDFRSQSGAVLPSIGYRFNESFSVEFGMAIFYGRWQSSRMALNPLSLGNQAGEGAYKDFSERGLAVVRDRDEVFVRLRKTF